MTIFLLNQELAFPPVERSEPDGLLAIGGDLSVPRLLLAYRSGIFPWYSEPNPILWHSPNPRMVLTSDALRVNRSLRKAIRKSPFTLTMDQAFPQVIHACSKIPRPGQHGTWITRDMLNAYIELHLYGVAHSVEAWLDDRLVGGLYGVSIGGLFCGESMFATENNASKIAFVALIQQLARWQIFLTDCQVYTEHLAHFGAALWPREDFLWALKQVIDQPTKSGKWSFDDDFQFDL